MMTAFLLIKGPELKRPLLLLLLKSYQLVSMMISIVKKKKKKVSKHLKKIRDLV